MERQTLTAQRKNGGAHLNGAPDSQGKSGDSTESTSEGAFDAIGAALRQIHEKVVSEEIPEDFLRLLDELDESLESLERKRDK